MAMFFNDVGDVTIFCSRLTAAKRFFHDEHMFREFIAHSRDLFSRAVIVRYAAS